jgi:hypothetical protein
MLDPYAEHSYAAPPTAVANLGEFLHARQPSRAFRTYFRG